MNVLVYVEKTIWKSLQCFAMMTYLEILLSIFFTINDTIFVHPKFWSFEEFTVLDNVCYLAKNVWDMFANAIMVTHQKNHITYVCTKYTQWVRLFGISISISNYSLHKYICKFILPTSFSYLFFSSLGCWWIAQGPKVQWHVV